MKALSIWQPWASLFMSEHKKIETRSWPAPYSIRGQRIAIASTKTIRPEQRKPVSEDAFRVHYAATGLADLQKLPMGCVLGSVTVVRCKEIDSELLLELNEQEEAFGIYGPGRFAWLLADPEPLDRPVVVRGGQGALELVSRVTMTPEGNFLPFFGYLASVLRVRTSLTPPLNFRRSLFHPNQGSKIPSICWHFGVKPLTAVILSLARSVVDVNGAGL